MITCAIATCSAGPKFRSLRRDDVLPAPEQNSGARLAIAWVCLARERGFATPARRVTVLKPIVC